jgi:hypothetical protein
MFVAIKILSFAIKIVNCLFSKKNLMFGTIMQMINLVQIFKKSLKRFENELTLSIWSYELKIKWLKKRLKVKLVV